MNFPSVEAATISVSVNTGIEPSIDLSKPTGAQEAWYDIEYGCHVLEDCPLPPLEKDDLAPTVAQDNHPLLGSPQRATSHHIDGNAQCISEEPGADTLPQPRREDGEYDCGNSVSELEKDMLLAFKEQDDLSRANTLNSPHPQHLSSELVQPQICQEAGQSGTSIAGLEELIIGRTQAEEGEVQEQ
jgi:hypothetical protein